MVYIINTANSVYEIDTDNKRIRKVYSGKETQLKLSLSDWKSYHKISPPKIDVGERLTIFWGHEFENAYGESSNCTETSRIVSKSKKSDLN